MSLAEAFAVAADTPTPARTSRVDIILADLDDADRSALLNALRDPNVKTSTIVTVLRQNGHQVAASTVGNYRKERLESAK